MDFIAITTPKLTCQFKEHLGVECPGCGIQRAIELLLNGKIIESIKMYPPLIPFFITFALLAIYLKTANMKWQRIFFVSLYSTIAIIFINYFLKFF